MVNHRIAQWCLRIAASTALGAGLAVVASYTFFTGALSALNFWVSSEPSA